MAPRRRTRFDARGVSDGARTIPFYAGAMHYWRVPRAKWAACLRAIHGLGLTLVETYVPWRVHEPARGDFDWDGELDLPAFIDAARAAGLGVVLRPGPHVNAELTSFGMPDWVLAEKACQAVTARGTPAWMPSPPRAWPIPSYASTAFRAHVAAWYREVGRVVGDREIVAVGVDNEAQLFFRTGAFDLDYHPDAVAWFGEDAPRDASDVAKAVRWVRFKDDYIARALGDFSAMLDGAGFEDVARFHNLPPGHHGLYDLRRVQSRIGGPVGIDAYTPRSGFAELRQRALACVGNASPVPIGFEVGVGFFPWFPPLDTHADDPTRERDHLLTLLSAGVRGFNLFMAVERDRYYGAAISQAGTVEAHAAWIKPLVGALAEVDWPSLRRHAAIALVDTRADARFGIATSLIDPVTPVLADAMGLPDLGEDPAAVLARRWQTAVAKALELAQVPYVIVDEQTPAEELAKFRAVIAPTQHRIDRALAETLRALAEAKKTVVVIGPHSPARDELDHPLEPLRRVGKLRDGSLEDAAGLAEDLAQLAGELDDAWQVERGDARCAAFSDPAGAVRVVFVWSDAPKVGTATLLADAAVLRDPFSGERIRVASGKAQVAVPAHGIRMLVVE